MFQVFGFEDSVHMTRSVITCYLYKNYSYILSLLFFCSTIPYLDTISVGLVTQISTVILNIWKNNVEYDKLLPIFGMIEFVPWFLLSNRWESTTINTTWFTTNKSTWSNRKTMQKENTDKTISLENSNNIVLD